MARDVNLTSQAWCDLVFEGKNKSYGAYALRQKSSDRHLKAMFIVLATVVTVIFSVKLIYQIAETNKAEHDSIDGNVSMTTVNLSDPKPEQQIVQEKPEPVPPIKAAIKYVVPTIDQNAPDETDMNTVDEVTKSKAIVSSIETEGSDDPDAVNPNTLDKKVTTVTAEVVEKKTFEVAEVMPSYPGGDKELTKYLSDNLRYPAVDIDLGTKGLVVLRFVVGENGKISDIKVIRSLSPTCDKEAMRVVKSMKDWIPGRQNGKAVSVYFSLPVRFQLEN